MDLKTQFQWYREHQDELVRAHSGKVLLIHDCAVVDTFASELDAANHAAGHFSPGTYLIQKCEPGEESYTRVFHSRVYQQTGARLHAAL